MVTQLLENIAFRSEIANDTTEKGTPISPVPFFHVQAIMYRHLQAMDPLINTSSRPSPYGLA
ncbi:hypothetical protein CGA22_15730 [Pseudomonas sp. PSB18]|nr:hypothetical protein [Pseudomonas sp. PSB18]